MIVVLFGSRPVVVLDMVQAFSSKKKNQCIGKGQFKLHHGHVFFAVTLLKPAKNEDKTKVFKLQL